MRKRNIWALAIPLCVLASSFAVAGRVPVSALRLQSPDLPAGKRFPAPFIGHDYGCTGQGISPALTWSGAPAKTQSFAVTMYDPYRPPQAGWWHWLMYDIPAGTTGLARGAGNPGGRLPAGAKMGLADADVPEHRYYGPCPDKGDPPHHYVITVYALDVPRLGVPVTASPADIDYTAAAHVLARAVIIRDYQR